MTSQGNPFPGSSSPLPSCPQTPVKPVVAAGSPVVADLGGGVVQETGTPEIIVRPSSTPSSVNLQQNASSNCGRLNQSFSGTSCLASSDINQPISAKLQLELSARQQPVSQQPHPHQSPMHPTVQEILQQQDQMPTHQFPQQVEQSQHLQQSQQLSQNQQLQQSQQLSQNQQLQQSQQLSQNQQLQQSQQLSQNQQLQQNQQLSQNQQLQQQLQQNQQIAHLGQQLQLGQHIQTGSQLPQCQQFQTGQQLQQTLQLQSQLQQGQQLLQSQNQQQLQQLMQQHGQPLLQSQQSQVQQLLQQQQGSQLLQQHLDQQLQQNSQSFLQNQGQPVMQQQGQSVMQQQGQPIIQQQQGQSVLQQSTGQPQCQSSQRYLAAPTQHLMSQSGQQQLLQQAQLVQPLQQQLLQQVGQQSLLTSLQPAGQQLYQSAQPGMFQQQSNQQLLQAQLLQSQAGQQLLQQQQFQVNQQQQQAPQQLLPTQQFNNMQHQIVLQAIQTQGSGNLSGITGRSLSLVPSGSSIGLVNTVPANVYRHLVSSIGTSSTTLATQTSKSNLVAGTRGTLNQPSAQRPSTVQVVQQRQNTPLFIGQFGMVPNGAIIPSGIVPLGRSQVSGTGVQSSNGQPQILASPTQIQLAAPLLGSAGNILSQQTLQAMAQLQQQQQQQSPGANLLTSQQPLYIQTGLSLSDGNGAVAGMTLPRTSTPSGAIQPLGLSGSLPVQIPIGVAGLGQQKSSWSSLATTVVSSFSPFQLDAGQMKATSVPDCSDLSQSLTIESIPHNSFGQNCGDISGQDYAVTLGFDSQLNLASQGHVVTGLVNNKNLLDSNNRHDCMKPEKVPTSSVTLSDCNSSDRVTKDCELNATANPEKQTAKVMPQILTHIIEGFVIQEGPEPFPVQRSSFMSEYLDSTDETTDTSCDGPSGDEADDGLKTAVSTVSTKELQDVSVKQRHFTKDTAKFCTCCAKQYELPAFGKTGKFCSQSCAKRSAAASRWTMYHINKQSEATSPIKQPVRRRSSNFNGRGWIRANEGRNTISAHLQKQAQMASLSAVNSIQTTVAIPVAIVPKTTSMHIAPALAPRLDFESSSITIEQEASVPIQQRSTPVQLLTSPRQDRVETVHHQPAPTASRENQVEDLDPTHKHPSEWGVQDVYTFVKNLPGCSSYADEFRLQEIDGQALLLLKEDHLMTTLNLKLGPALKICQQIAALKDSFS